MKFVLEVLKQLEDKSYTLRWNRRL